MSVLFVTDDADGGILIETKRFSHDQNYKQLKQSDYDLSGKSYSVLKSSSSIIVKSNQYYREDRRRRICRLQACLVKHTLTYMLIVLLLAQNLHWPLVVLSLTSMNIVTVRGASSRSMRSLSSKEETNSDPALSPSSVSTNQVENDKNQCQPFQEHHIERICSKTCRVRNHPFDDYENITHLISQIFYLPFCSHHLIYRSLDIMQLLSDADENRCQETLNNIILYDRQAQNASEQFKSYMKAIDSASDENRYSIVKADCQEAYRTWACSVNIPFFYRNKKIMPCQTICDEVERVCPTFRPSDREPLFAGQPLFYCNGGIVANSDYSRKPYCFDKCHLVTPINEEHSFLSSSSSSEPTMSTTMSFENYVGRSECFEIQLIDDARFYFNESLLSASNETRFDLPFNNSLTSSAKTFRSSLLSLTWFILLVLLL